ncbi:hypothetical protein [Nocardia sp. XZ_19_369]|nr:hypothetical protein [Nocardia sp. XZ_19_369]
MRAIDATAPQLAGEVMGSAHSVGKDRLNLSSLFGEFAAGDKCFDV